MIPARTVRAIHVVWFVAVVLTLIGAIESTVVTGRPLVAGIALIVITMIKVVFVVGEYMEIRYAPTWLKAVALAWMTATAAILTAATLYAA